MVWLSACGCAFIGSSDPGPGSMLNARRLLIARVLDIESADPVIELPRQTRQSSRRHSKQRIDLVRGQLNPELETGTRRIPKELSPKTGVRQQTTECAFHVSLTHASSIRQGLHQACF